MTSAWVGAAAAAAAAGVVIRSAMPADCGALSQLFGDTWGAARAPDAALLQAAGHAGNTVLVAAANQVIVGGLFGFLGWQSGLHMHSHMAAVRPGARRAGVGYALKLAQRAHCLDHGIGEVRWTYDPLIRRNAHLNLAKLGAEVRAFHQDFYGILNDAVTGDDRSDRFEVSWQLGSAAVREALAGRRSSADATAAVARLDLEADFEQLRSTDPARALRLRLESRPLFAGALQAGQRIRYVDGAYLFLAAGGGR